MIGVLCTWIYLLAYIARSFRKVPKLNATKSAKWPKVSVIIPARNEEHFIRPCLATIGTQDYPNYHIIAVDDSSTDRTVNLIKEHASQLSLLILFLTDWDQNRSEFAQRLKSYGINVKTIIIRKKQTTHPIDESVSLYSPNNLEEVI